MSICILFILFNGSGYLTPACYDGYELITPHNVAFVQHIPSEYEYNLYESPDYYLDYYWDAREKYCRSWGQGWAFWTPQTQPLCRKPRYLSTVHYHSIPYRVRYNVRNRLKTNHHYKNSYKKHRGHKKYKKYGKRRNHHVNYKKHYKKHSKKHHRTSYKKRVGNHRNDGQRRKKSNRRHSRRATRR